MKENRTIAKFFAGLLVVSAVAVGGMSPAQAKDTGWNGTVAPSNGPSVKAQFMDSGWNGT